MIDTDKYEGHTPAPWVAKHDLVETEAKYGGTFTHIINSDGWRVWLGESNDINDEPRDDDVDTTLVENSRFGSENLGEADAQLIADAPLLLAEYKRLRGLLKITAQSYLDYVRAEDMLGEVSVKKEYETCKEIGDVIGATINDEYYFTYEKEGEEE